MLSLFKCKMAVLVTEWSGKTVEIYKYGCRLPLKDAPLLPSADESQITSCASFASEN